MSKLKDSFHHQIIMTIHEKNPLNKIFFPTQSLAYGSQEFPIYLFQ